METYRSVKIVLTVSYVLQIASLRMILHTCVHNLVHFSYCKRFSFSFYLVFEGTF